MYQCAVIIGGSGSVVVQLTLLLDRLGALGFPRIANPYVGISNEKRREEKVEVKSWCVAPARQLPAPTLSIAKIELMIKALFVVNCGDVVIMQTIYNQCRKTICITEA